MSRRAALLIAALGLGALALAGARQAMAARVQLGAAPDSPLDLWAMSALPGWDALPGPVESAPWHGEATVTDAPAGEYATESAAEEGGDIPVLDTFLLPAAYSVGGLFMSKKMLSIAGLDALRRHEGFSSVPYRDAAGHWTIGYGHKVAAGEDFASVTEAQAMQLLAGDVNAAEDAVNALVRVPLTQAQFDALVSFVYNVGAGAFRSSTLLKVLNAGDYAQVPAQLARWRFVTRGGQKVELAGLVSRRSAEGALFASGGSGGVFA